MSDNDDNARSWVQDGVNHTLIPLPDGADTDMADAVAGLVERHLRTLFGDRVSVSVIDTSTDEGRVVGTLTGMDENGGGRIEAAEIGVHLPPGTYRLEPEE